MIEIGILNIGLSLFAGVLVAILLGVGIRSCKSGSRREWLQELTIASLLLLIVTAVKQCVYSFADIQIVFCVLGFVDYALVCCVASLFFLYVFARIALLVDVPRWATGMLLVWSIVACVLFASSYATGLFFTFDASGAPHTTGLCWILQAMVLVILLVAAVLAALHRKCLPSSIVVLAWAFFAFALVASVIDTALGTNLAYAVVALVLTVAYFLEGEQTHAQVQDSPAQSDAIINRDAATRAIIRQLQPHFMFSVLNNVMLLVRHNPDEAVDVLADFSDYLRTNLEVMAIKTTVPFDRELLHICSYANLEKHHYGNKLQVEYNIETTDFDIAPLAVQALVENAIKHGVGELPDGGSVWLSTREDEGNYYILVRDNGSGFDVASFEGESELDANNCFGIRDTRERLHAFCDGTLTIESMAGNGTIAMITLPKSNKQE